MTLLQRVNWPVAADPGVISLFLDQPDRDVPSAQAETGQEGRDEDAAFLDEEDDAHQVLDGSERARIEELRRYVDADARLNLPPDTAVSLAGYFSAFPAGYWATWTSVRTVRLALTVAGSATVRVWSSTAAGYPRLLADLAMVDGEVHHDVDITGFAAGGWLWCDLVAGAQGATVSDVRWEAVAAGAVADELATIAITTMNKPEYCVVTLDRLADAGELLPELDRIVVVDQGADLLRDHPDFPAVAQRLGERLRVVEQPNLGGSGGFSRGMVEALSSPRSSHVLLLDDDVVVDPESIRRAIVVARLATGPIVVGGQMLDLNHRGVLHAMAERIDEVPFLWGATPGTWGRHDFTTGSLRQTPWLHGRYDADFNGWWMCLIPLDLLRRVGLSAPFFLKWDDAEFGLRAKAAGVPTVSFPGIALWHVAWLDKDDGVDWQAYFHHRNRTVAALLHSDHALGGLLLRDSLRLDIKHLISMQYSTLLLRHQALRDVLAGPGLLQNVLAERVGQVRALATSLPDGVRRDPATLPRPSQGLIADGKPEDGRPTGVGMMLFAGQAVARALLKPVPASARTVPQVVFAPRYGSWWRLPAHDSALVPTADRKAVFWYRRRRREVARLLGRTLALHVRLALGWRGLREQFRREMPEQMSEAAWRRHLGLGD